MFGEEKIIDSIDEMNIFLHIWHFRLIFLTNNFSHIDAFLGCDKLQVDNALKFLFGTPSHNSILPTKYAHQYVFSNKN